MHRSLLKVQRALQHVERSVAEFIRRSFTGRPVAVAATAGAFGIALFFAAGWTAYVAYDLTTGLPTREQLRDIGDMVQSTTIFDATTGPPSRSSRNSASRVPLDQMSRNFINAVISVEDQRFFDHSGVDAVRVGGAVMRNLREGRRAEGGSTITQQLARLMFLNRGKTYRRKLQGDHRRRLPREPLHEAGDSRDVPQQGVLRRRPARRRGGLARLFRQARRRSARSRRRRSSRA